MPKIVSVNFSLCKLSTQLWEFSDIEYGESMKKGFGNRFKSVDVTA